MRTLVAGQSYVSKRIAGDFAAGSGSATALADAAPITPREKEVLSPVARGYGNPDIAGLLGTSVLTVRTHRQRLMEKLGLRNAAEITACAIQARPLRPDLKYVHRITPSAYADGRYCKCSMAAARALGMSVAGVTEDRRR